MRTVEEIKADMLEKIDRVLEKNRLFFPHEGRTDIALSFTADGLLDATRKHLDSLALNGIVSGKMLQEAFPTDKLRERNIHIDRIVKPVQYTEGLHYFFGKTTAELLGPKVEGHFFEESHGYVKEGRAQFYDRSTGKVEQSPFVIVMDQAEVQTYHSKTNVGGQAKCDIHGDSKVQTFEQCVVTVHDNARVEAFDQSKVTFNGNATGVMKDRTRFEGNDNSRLTIMGQSRGTVNDSCQCSISEQAIAIYTKKGNIDDNIKATVARDGKINCTPIRHKEMEELLKPDQQAVPSHTLKR